MPRDDNPTRDLLPEEEAAGSEDPEAEGAAILDDSETREDDRLASGDRVEHRSSSVATAPPDEE